MLSTSEMAQTFPWAPYVQDKYMKFINNQTQQFWFQYIHSTFISSMMYLILSIQTHDHLIEALSRS